MAIDLCNSNSVSDSDPFRISKTMEASVRILKHHPIKYPLFRLPYYNPLPRPPSNRILAISSNPDFPPPSRSPLPPPSSIEFPTSFRSFQFQSLSANNFASTAAGSANKSFEWKFASNVNGGDVGVVGGKGPMVTAVLLGWLGAKRRYLRKYVEMYNARGFNTATLFTSVSDVLGSDLRRLFEARAVVLAQELGSWLAESRKDGRDRRLIFHTFSNTGWLT